MDPSPDAIEPPKQTDPVDASTQFRLKCGTYGHHHRVTGLDSWTIR
jgi:hypothetical protein